MLDAAVEDSNAGSTSRESEALATESLRYNVE